MPQRSRRSKRAAKAGPQAPPRARARSRWPLVLGAIFVLALIWRIAYFMRLQGSPLFGAISLDGTIYWQWSSYLIEHGFRGRNAFFMGPLYPYVLALLRTALGSDFLRLMLVQAVWGSLAAALLADAARRTAGVVAGVVAGVLAALYGMCVFFDGQILMESLLFFLEALLVWLMLRDAGRAQGARRFALLGALVGLITLGRGTGLLFLAPVAWLAVQGAGDGGGRRAAWRRGGVAIATCALAILPATLWNWHAAHEFIPITYNTGYNLYAGNNAEAMGGAAMPGGPAAPIASPGSTPDGGAEGDGRAFLRNTEGVALTPVESSAYWAKRAWTWVREHPGTAVLDAVRKVLLMLNHREYTQFYSHRLFGAEAGPLGLPLAGTFWVVGFLGLIGLALGSGGRAADGALRLYALAVLAGVVPFFVTDRYRHHLLPALFVGAGIAVVRLHAAWAQRARRGLVRPALVAFVAAALVAWPLVDTPPAAEAWADARDLGARWLELRRPDRAVPAFERALGYEQELLAEGRAPIDAQRALLRFNLAAAEQRLGRTDTARRDFERAARLDPGNGKFALALAAFYDATGDARRADSLLEARRAAGEGGPQFDLALAFRAARAGDLAHAEVLFERVIAADRANMTARGALIRLRVLRGDLDGAAHLVADSRAAGMDEGVASLYEALIAASRGEADAARAALARVPPDVTRFDSNLGRVRARIEQLLGE